MIDPTIAPALIDARGLLHVKGFVPTRPEQVDFEFFFEWSGGAWKIFSLSVFTRVGAPPAAP